MQEPASGYKISQLDGQTILDLLYMAQAGSGCLEEGNIDLNVLKSEAAKVPMIMVTSMLRSSSTALTNIIKEILGLKFNNYCIAYYNVENELSLASLLFNVAEKSPSISLSHTKATYVTCHFIEMFSIKPIIVIRNIYETAVNIAMYYRQSYNFPHFDSGYFSAAMSWVDSRIKGLSDSELINMVIDYYLPWHINFYLSWKTVISRNEIEGYILNVEKLKANTDQEFKKLFHYIDLPIKEQLDPSDLYHNRYKPGYYEYIEKSCNQPLEYWKSLLTKSHVDKIKSLTKSFPGFDFSEIYEARNFAPNT